MTKEEYIQEKNKILESGLDNNIIAAKCLCLWYEYMRIPLGNYSTIIRSSEIRSQS